jgi:hypothetical protein
MKADGPGQPPAALPTRAGGVVFPQPYLRRPCTPNNSAAPFCLEPSFVRSGRTTRTVR